MPYVVTLVVQDSGGSTGRLVIGRLLSNTYSILWDSPLISTRYFDLDYEDLTGDGVSEILIRSQTSGNVTYPRLVAFDVSGNELTRQGGVCEEARYEPFDSSDGTCPIRSDTEIEFIPGRGGKKNIVVKQGFATRRFYLVGQHYVLVRKSK